MKLKLILIFSILIGFASCVKEIKGVKNISVIELKNRINNGSVQLLDVRTAKECANGTIKNALEIDITATNFEQQAIKSLDKSKPVYIYCRSGGRSLIASKILTEKGYKVYNVEGGYMAWIDKNK